MPDNLTPRQANTHRQQLSRAKCRYRALLDQHGGIWQQEVATLISQTWNQLTALDDDLLLHINNHRAAWQNLTKPDILPNMQEPTANPSNPQSVNGNCHELTDLSTPDLSHYNPLYSGVICDSDKPHQLTTAPGMVMCPITGVTIEQPQSGQRFVSAAMLRNNDDLLMTLDRQHRQYAKGSKEDLPTRTAHNIRNAYHNPRNNLRRRLKQMEKYPTLFGVSQTVRLTPEQRAALDYCRAVVKPDKT